MRRLHDTDTPAFFRCINLCVEVGSSHTPVELLQHFANLLGGSEPPLPPPRPEQPPGRRPPPELPPQQPAAAAAASPPGQQQPGGEAGNAAARQLQADLANLTAQMQNPFTAAIVAAHCHRLKGRKAVAGSLPPWFLKAASSQLAHTLAVLFNAWVRVGQLSAAEALSVIFPTPKPGGLDGLCGIAVGTLPAKLFACILE